MRNKGKKGIIGSKWERQKKIFLGEIDQVRGGRKKGDMEIKNDLRSWRREVKKER